MNIIDRILRKLIITNRLLIPARPPRLSHPSDEISMNFTGTDCMEEMLASDLFNGFSDKTSVLIKINANSSFDYPASTSIDMVKTVISMLKAKGVKKILVTDCTAISRLPSNNVLRQKGLYDLQDNIVKVRTFDYGPWVRVILKDCLFKDIRLPKVIYKYDRIINLTNIKAHRLSGYTSAIKNLVGFMHPHQRFLLHENNLEKRITEIPQAVIPDINIIDARKILITGGPDHGESYPADTIIADSDLERTDSAAYDLLIKTQKTAGVEPLQKRSYNL